MKSPILILSFLLVAATVYAQKKVLFNVKYLPNHTYKSTIRTEMGMEMTEAATNTAAESSIKLDYINVTDITSLSGKAKTGGAFPISFKLDKVDAKVTANGEEKAYNPSPLQGKAFNTESAADGLVKIDTISGNEQELALKKLIRGQVQQLLTKVKFPDKPLTIGDTFTEEMPIDFPGFNGIKSFAIKITYKLIQIKEGKAVFDISHTFNLNTNDTMNGTKVIIKGNGSGMGKLIYSISNNFIETLDSNVSLILNIEAPEKGKKMAPQVNLATAIRTVVTPN